MRSSDFVITRMITDRIGLHSVHYKMRGLIVSLKETTLTSKFERKKLPHSLMKQAAILKTSSKVGELIIKIKIK